MDANMIYKKVKKLFKNGELKDALVLSTIDRARQYYEDGAIIEAHDTLLEVIDAIEEFDKEQET